MIELLADFDAGERDLAEPPSRRPATPRSGHPPLPGGRHHARGSVDPRPARRERARPWSTFGRFARCLGSVQGARAEASLVRSRRERSRPRPVAAVRAGQETGEPLQERRECLARRHGEREPSLAVLVREDLRVQRRSKLVEDRLASPGGVPSCDLAEEIERCAEEGATGLRESIVLRRARGDRFGSRHLRRPRSGWRPPSRRWPCSCVPARRRRRRHRERSGPLESTHSPSSAPRDPLHHRCRPIARCASLNTCSVESRGVRDPPRARARSGSEAPRTEDSLGSRRNSAATEERSRRPAGHHEQSLRSPMERFPTDRRCDRLVAPTAPSVCPAAGTHRRALATCLQGASPAA